MRISVIGCGRWGSFIGWYLDRIGHGVTIYGRPSSKHMLRLIGTRRNEYISLGDSIALTTSLPEALDADTIVISVGSQALAGLAAELAGAGVCGKTFVLCMKGLEIGTGRRLSQVVADAVDSSNKIAVWLGPGHVEEFCRGVPNCMVIDSEDEDVKKKLVSAFSGNIIRFYYGADLIGNELGAATKNIIGIAAGMLDGMDLTTLKGSLMSRGTNEVSRLIEANGGNKLSAYGLCHLGDYEATLFSSHSHNRLFGELFVQGKPYDKLAEGYYTVKAAKEMGDKFGIELPIISGVYNILYEGKTPMEEFDKLFSRSLKQEF